GVELSRVVQETATPGVGGAGAAGIGVEQTGQVPPSVRGELRGRVASVAQQLPQLVGGGHAAREAAGHADDRDRLAGRGRRRVLRSGRGGARRPDVRGERGGGRVVEQRRAGQPYAG